MRLRGTRPGDGRISECERQAEGGYHKIVEVCHSWNQKPRTLKLIKALRDKGMITPNIHEGILQKKKKISSHCLIKERGQEMKTHF